MEWLLAAVIGYALMPLLAAFTSSYAARPRSRHDSGRNPDTRPLLRPPMLLISIPASAASYAESSGWVLVPNCGPHTRNSGSRESERTSRRKSSARISARSGPSRGASNQDELHTLSLGKQR